MDEKPDRRVPTSCPWIRSVAVKVGLALLLMLRAAGGAEFHVSPDGSDEQAGTRKEPFRTIQKAAEVMQPGDTCFVGPGVYGESVRPARSGRFDEPISFLATTGVTATVTVTGGDRLTNWQIHTGAVYRVKVASVCQVLVDDEPAEELYAMPTEEAGLHGAWWRGPDGMLYLRCPLNAAPIDCDIEVQTRRWGFDLSGLSHIVIKGFDIRAGGVDLDEARFCRVEDCRVWWGGGGRGSDAGRMKPGKVASAAIRIGGSENDVTQCAVVGSTEEAVALVPGSVNNRLTESRIRLAGGRSGDAYAICVAGTAHTVDHVTVTDGMGGGLLCSNVYNARLLHNEFQHTGQKGHGRPMVRVTGDGKGTILAFNRIHDNASDDGDGVLLDGPVENYILHHNVVWGQRRSGIRLKGSVRYTFVFSNTFTANGDGLDVDDKNSSGPFKGLRFFNNIFAGRTWMAFDRKPSEGVSWENNYVGSAPGFVNEATRDFRLKEGSPCIDKGEAAPEFTDEYNGRSPDLGAFEFSPDEPVPISSNTVLRQH